MNEDSSYREARQNVKVPPTTAGCVNRLRVVEQSLNSLEQERKALAYEISRDGGPSQFIVRGQPYDLLVEKPGGYCVKITPISIVN